MIFPRLTNTQNILLWANQLIGVLERNKNEIFSSFARQDTGGTVRLDGRIQVNQTASDPDVSTDARVGEIRYNAGTNSFQGFTTGGWQDFH